jgi:hypothetical protein
MFSWKTREYAQEVFAVRLAIGTFLALGDPGVIGPRTPLLFRPFGSQLAQQHLRQSFSR